MASVQVEKPGDDAFVAHHEDEKQASRMEEADDIVPEKEEESSAMQEYRATIASFSPQEQKRIMRKVDWRIMPIVAAMFFICLLDRGNCKPPP